MNKGELKEILRLHKLWFEGGSGGVRANLRCSDLSGINLRGSDLSGSNLSGSNLSGSNLRGSDLRCSDLSGSNLRGSDLPSPSILLLCKWGEVSPELTNELMNYDSSNHPHPEQFDEWAKGGQCPYKRGFARCAHFQEQRELWQKLDHVKSARELVLMLFKEKEIKYSEDI